MTSEIEHLRSRTEGLSVSSQPLNPFSGLQEGGPDTPTPIVHASTSQQVDGALDMAEDNPWREPGPPISDHPSRRLPPQPPQPRRVQTALAPSPPPPAPQDQPVYQSPPNHPPPTIACPPASHPTAQPMVFLPNAYPPDHPIWSNAWDTMRSNPWNSH